MNDYKKGELIYEGKAKKIFSVLNNKDCLWLEFKDSLTAFNAVKKGSFNQKGVVNRKIASLIFKFLQSQDIPSHWLADYGDRDMICKKLDIIPIEVVVRNKLAGSTAKKFGIKEGLVLNKPLVEFYYKNDALADPFMSDDQALMMKAANSQSELDELKQRALKVNAKLIEFFKAVKIDLIDFKLEFGRDDKSKICLADEITPDSCRLWDEVTQEKLDKDRFRQDLGLVEEKYLEVLDRLNNHWKEKL